MLAPSNSTNYSGFRPCGSSCAMYGRVSRTHEDELVVMVPPAFFDVGARL